MKNIVSKYFLSLLLYGFLLVAVSYGQKPVDVAESSVKVGIKGEEMVYYGFAEGDQLIFSFEETGGKEMKEIEIVEMPSSSKFLEFKTSKIENKTINIARTGIYKFRFANAALLQEFANTRYNVFLPALPHRTLIQLCILMSITIPLILMK